MEKQNLLFFPSLSSCHEEATVEFILRTNLHPFRVLFISKFFSCFLFFLS